MNACLADLSAKVVSSFRQALRDLGITAPFFISQNDGTLMTPEHVERYPVLTFASGPTNSMRGAAMLAGTKEAMVVDIGGVRTNFRMPDVLAVGLGGGSLVRDEGRRIGPRLGGLRDYPEGARLRRGHADHHRHRGRGGARGHQRPRAGQEHPGQDHRRGARHHSSHGRRDRRPHEDQRRPAACGARGRRLDPRLARPLAPPR